MDRKLSFYSPQLDVLRFMAALLVFFHHAPSIPMLEPLKTFGWVGVDLFLVISAFLLTRLLSLEWKSTGTISLKDFFIRRALRIWPLFFCYASAMCGWALLKGDIEAETILAWWLSFITFSNNLLSAVEGYSPVPYTGHLWTIALEEQAYIALPIILLLLMNSHVSLKNIFLLAFGAILLLIAIRTVFVLVGTKHPFIWVLPLRADPFILGGVAAIFMEHKTISRPYIIFFLGTLLMASVALFPAVNVPGSFQIIGYTILAFGCTAVVVSVQASIFMKSFFSWQFLRYAGKISFGIYIYHIFCIAAARKLLSLVQTGDTEFKEIAVWCVGFTLTIIASVISYEILEKPFLKIKHRYTKVNSRLA